MAIADPAQLLERIPELEPLAEHPGIRKAIATGDTFKVYRALWWAKLLRRLPQHKAALDALLRNRRLFAKPLKGTPGLGSINSVGFGFVGESEREADGTHIALHAFVVLFAIPLIPLGSYWVQRESSSGLSSRWRIFARVPMGGLGWLYSRGIAAAALGLIGLGGYSAFHASGHQEVTVVNGFDAPVKVVLAGQSQTVAAHGMATIDVADGKVEGKATLEDGTEIETFSHEVHASADNAIWNIGGIAPIYETRVVYYQEGTDPPPGAAGPEPTFHCGQSYFEAGSFDDTFTEPPANISMPKGAQTSERSLLQVYTDNGKPSETMCIQYALGRGDFKAYGRMFEAYARRTGWNEAATSLAYMAAREAGDGRSLELARNGRAAHPESMDAQRTYFDALESLGRKAEARAEIAAMLARQPTSLQARYLDAVFTDGQPGLDKLLALRGASEGPDNAYVLRSAIWREWRFGRMQAAADDWDALLSIAPAEAVRVVEAKVDAELALGRPRNALKALEDLAGTEAGKDDANIASYYALVAARTGDAPDTLFKRIDTEHSTPSLLRYYADRGRVKLEPLPETDHDDLAGLARELPASPERGLQRLHAVRTAELRALGPEHWALLYGEAARKGERDTMAMLGRWSAFGAEDLKRMADYATGQPVALAEIDIDPITHAALDLVRSRNSALSGDERARLRASAVAGDRLHGAITDAASAWQ